MNVLRVTHITIVVIGWPGLPLLAHAADLSRLRVVLVATHQDDCVNVLLDPSTVELRRTSRIGLVERFAELETDEVRRVDGNLLGRTRLSLMSYSVVEPLNDGRDLRYGDARGLWILSREAAGDSIASQFDWRFTTGDSMTPAAVDA